MSESSRLHVTHFISCPASGGAEVYVNDLAIAAVERGHSASIIFLDRAEEMGRDEEYQREFLAKLDSGGVKYRFIGAKARRNPLFGWVRTRKLLRELGADVVHAHLYYGVIFSAWCGRPIVYTHHNTKPRYHRAVYRLLFNKIISTYVGISAVGAEALRQGGCWPVVKINNGVNPERLQVRCDAREAAEDPFTFLAVGRLTKQKNYPRLLRSLATLPKEHSWRLQVAGEGSEREALENLVLELGLSDRVEFLGAITNVSERMHAANTFVMSSAWEGLPIALIEATLVGLPVVVTNVGGCAEVVHAASNGLVVDDVSDESFACALRRMLDDDKMRAFFSRNARLYGSKYELSTAVREHLRLYSALESSGSKPKGDGFR